MKYILITIFSFFPILNTYAYIKYHPVTFVLSTDKKSYYESEKLHFYC